MRTWHKARDLDKQFREQGGDPRFVTADEYDILDEEVYWNNELKATRVLFSKTRFGRHWDGWFYCVHPDSGQVMAIMNGERLAKLFEGKRPV